MGMSALIIQELFQQIEEQQNENLKFEVQFSYLEIYNESVLDMLTESATKNLVINEDPVKGLKIQNLKYFDVKTIQEAEYLLDYGNSKRTLAATYANQHSSRSHAIIQINVKKIIKNE